MTLGGRGVFMFMPVIPNPPLTPLKGGI